MQPFHLRLIGNTDIRMRQFRQLLHRLRLGHPTIGRRKDAQARAFAFAKGTQVIEQQAQARHLQERNDKIDFVCTGNLAPDLLSQRQRTVSSGKEVAHAEARFGAHGGRLAVRLQKGFLFHHHFGKQMGIIHNLVLRFQTIVRQSPVDHGHLVLYIRGYLQLLTELPSQIVSQNFRRFGFIHDFALASQALQFQLLDFLFGPFADDIFVNPCFNIVSC